MSSTSVIDPVDPAAKPAERGEFVPFTAQTRMSGVDADGASGHWIFQQSMALFD